MITGNEAAIVLKSLMPEGQQELSHLKWVLYFARRVQKGLWQDGSATPVPLFSQKQVPPGEVATFLSSLPSDCQRYFHGLVEALEIYQSIHGKEIPVDEASLRNGVVHELRQIRDMCLDNVNFHVAY